MLWHFLWLVEPRANAARKFVTFFAIRTAPAARPPTLRVAATAAPAAVERPARPATPLSGTRHRLAVAGHRATGAIRRVDLSSASSRATVWQRGVPGRHRGTKGPRLA